MEDDAAGMVLRLALKTRFSEMGWGSTPPSSAKHRRLPEWLREQFAKLSLRKWRIGSNPIPSASLMPARLGSQRGLIHLLAPD